MVWTNQPQVSGGCSAAASRKFYNYDTNPTGGVEADGDDKTQDATSSESLELVKYVARNVIGNDAVFSSPFGPRRVVYCDHTASGRSLSFLEEYIREDVLPQYGSTHTTATYTALQTTMFRHEARDVLRSAVRAGDQDRVLLTGTGATGAVVRLLHALDLRAPPLLMAGPFLHHSALLPWREAGARVIRIRETRTGSVDMHHLEQELEKHSTGTSSPDQHHRHTDVIGCFCAASNVTGVVTDSIAVTTLLHKYKALAFWDYATAAPYVPLDMNPVVLGDTAGLAHKDAMFFSMHKFLGGPQTPGVLVAKRTLFRHSVPAVPGGGGVFFVSRTQHSFLKEEENREEGGTPGIVESIRAGLVLQLKQSISTCTIATINRTRTRQLSELVSSTPNLVSLGPDCLDRLPILSFMVRAPVSGLFLHHNFVAALLNDLFGVQARGGCACAGPYAMDLMGINDTVADQYHKALAEPPELSRHDLRRRQETSDRELLRPGFVRLNICYTATDEEVDFILSSVRRVCSDGWRLLPLYTCNPETGEWKHTKQQVLKGRQWLGNVSYSGGRFHLRNRRDRHQQAPHYDACLAQADQIIGQADKLVRQTPDTAADQLLLPPSVSNLRWFLLGSEARAALLPSDQQPSTATLSKMSDAHSAPFDPVCYPLSREVLKARPDHVWLQEPRLHYWPIVADQPLSHQDENDSHCTQRQSPTNNIETNHTVEFNRVSNDNKSLVHDTSSEGLSAIAANHTDYTDAIPPGNKVDINKNNEQALVSSSTTPSNSTISTTSSSLSDNDLTSVVNSMRGGLQEDQGDAQFNSMTLEDDVLSNSCTTMTCFIPRRDDAPKPAEVEQLGITTDDKTKTDHTTQNEIVPNETTKKATANNKSPVTVEAAESVLNEVSLPSAKWHSPPKKLFTPMVEAVQHFSMIRDGDRVLLCLSGGKDSLSLLHLLHQYQYQASARGVQFSLGAVTVDPESSSYDPRPLIPYLSSLGVEYLYEKQGILQQALSLPDLNSICSFCSRMKRGRIYAAARGHGYNVLAFGQHLDDLAESFLMSVFHNGRLRTMKACYTVQEGDLRVIRPLVYVREKHLRHFAESRCLPVIPENCPACFEVPKERHRSKQLLAQQEVLFPQVYWSLRTALLPLMAISATGLENKVLGKMAALAGGRRAGEDADDE